MRVVHRDPWIFLPFPAISWRKGVTAGKDSDRLRRGYDPEEGCCFLGDVVISLDHLKAQAKEFGHSQAREAAYLLVHSLCHLMGYDHMEHEDKKRMRTMEEKILSNV